jgi:hypothetical protein
MTEQQVVDLMKSSTTQADWNKNIEKVKTAFSGNYPPFWYPAIIASGLMAKTMGEASTQIRVSTN